METLAGFLDIGWLATLVNKYDWVWPICEMLHFIGMALLIGTVGWLDIRILGFGKGVPIAGLEKLVPIGIVGFALNVGSGLVFVAGNPAGGPIAYLGNVAFQIKMLLILIAGLNLAAYYFTGIARTAANVPAASDAAPAAKAVAVVSLLAWFGVIYFGRMIMYEDTLLYAFGK
jgi:hypothetical protein